MNSPSLLQHVSVDVTTNQHFIVIVLENDVFPESGWVIVTCGASIAYNQRPIQKLWFIGSDEDFDWQRITRKYIGQAIWLCSPFAMIKGCFPIFKIAFLPQKETIGFLF